MRYPTKIREKCYNARMSKDERPHTKAALTEIKAWREKRATALGEPFEPRRAFALEDMPEDHLRMIEKAVAEMPIGSEK
jgi:hypothetical protein